MSKIIGNTTATPNPQPDWAQTDVTKADYIKNKPDIAGQKTTEGGEIFNDYNTNAALTESHAEGHNTIAGGKGFTINSKSGTDGEVGTYTLDSIEGIEKEDVYSVKLGNNYDYCGTITEIDSSTNTVTVSYYISGTSDTGTLWIPSKPKIGTGVLGSGAHSEGYGTIASTYGSHSEGLNTIAGGRYSHAEGNGTKAGYGAHSEGGDTEAIANYSHAEGSITKAKGTASHSEGIKTTALNNASHAEGEHTIAEGSKSHAEGVGTYAKGTGSHAEGRGKNIDENINKEYGALGDYSHSEGAYTISSGNNSHAEGYDTVASGENSHVENSSSTASGNNSHAEGYNTQATVESSHSENYKTVASGRYSHAGGFNSNATKDSSFVHGYYSNANGDYSAAFGNYTETDANYQFAVGNYNNVDERSNGQRPIFMVGNGANNNKKNVFSVYRNGTARVGADPINDMDVATKNYVDSSIGNYLPLSGGNMDSTAHINILNNPNGVDCGTTINSQRLLIAANPTDVGCNENSSLNSTQLYFDNVDNQSHIAYGEGGISFNVFNTDHFKLDSYGNLTLSDSAKASWISTLGLEEYINNIVEQKVQERLSTNN